VLRLLPLDPLLVLNVLFHPNDLGHVELVGRLEVKECFTL
jgi:hypothetical protein